MKRARVESDRVRAIRAAAAGWRRTGAIDEAVHAAILERFPPVRRAYGPLLTALVFFVSSVAVWAAFAAAALLVRTSQATAFGLLFLLGALALTVAAEGLLDSERLAESGGASAAAFWAAFFSIPGIVLSIDPNGSASTGRLIFGVAAAAFGAAVWRWGWPLLAAGSALSLLFLVASLTQSRPLLALAGALVAAGSVPFLDRPRLPLAYRESAHAVLSVGLLWAYAAVNRYSVDKRLFEELFGEFFRGRGSPEGASPGGLLWWAFTLLLPLALLAWGIAERRRIVLAAGLVAFALSAVTVRFYVHALPAWLALAGSGALLVAGAIAVERWLRAGPDRERGGFTADPLFDDERRQRAAGVVVAAATLSPAAAPRPAETGSRFTGGGGDSGGGGATEGF